MFENNPTQTKIGLEWGICVSQLAVFDARLYIRVRCFDEIA